mgnify:CR=1 FL=1
MHRVTADDLPEIVRFFRGLAVAEAPDDPAAGERGEAGLRRSLAAWDFLHSEACFLLLAHLEGGPAGYLLAVRIPKADARAGFLFVDELYVLPTFRRRGVARALVERVQALAVELGLAGVRLLVRPGNEAARRLYRQCGFEEHETIFCEWQVL